MTNNHPLETNAYLCVDVSRCTERAETARRRVCVYAGGWSSSPLCRPSRLRTRVEHIHPTSHLEHSCINKKKKLGDTICCKPSSDPDQEYMDPEKTPDETENGDPAVSYLGTFVVVANAGSYQLMDLTYVAWTPSIQIEDDMR